VPVAGRGALTLISLSFRPAARSRARARKKQRGEGAIRRRCGWEGAEPQIPPDRAASSDLRRWRAATGGSPCQPRILPYRADPRLDPWSGGRSRPEAAAVNGGSRQGGRRWRGERSCGAATQPAGDKSRRGGLHDTGSSDEVDGVKQRFRQGANRRRAMHHAGVPAATMAAQGRTRGDRDCHHGSAGRGRRRRLPWRWRGTLYLLLLDAVRRRTRWVRRGGGRCPRQRSWTTSLGAH